MSSDDLLDREILRYRASPLQFVKELLGATPEDWQATALQASAEHDRISIRSGHGVGKSTFLSWLVLHQHITRFPAKTGTTAPTEHQLRDILWAEIGTWYRRLPPALQAPFMLTDLRLELKAAPEESFAAGRVARPEKPEAFAGYHSDNMLLIGDEASGISEENYEVGMGAMSTKNARMVLAGNPTRPTGFFHKTHTSMRNRWYTMKVSSSDVERAQGHIDDVIAAYGKDSNAYRVRVLGDFPTSADEQVIGLDVIESAINRKIEQSMAFYPVWGLDVARFGNDRSALAKRRGNTLLEPVQAWKNLDTMQTAGRVKAEFEATPPDERPSEILVDVIGIGAGVVDRLYEMKMPARGVNVGETPAVGMKFMRQRDELWWRAREWFEARICSIPKDDELISELITPLYTFSSSGKIVIEAKDDQKKRLGKSPDLADALILTFAGGADRDYAADQINDRYAKRRRSNQPSSWLAV